MATVNKPILLDETGKAIVSALQAQTEALKNVSVAGNPADYIVDCEYVEGEVTLPSGETITAVTSWYEIYASGKVRQGGVCTEGIITTDEYSMEQTVILNIPMANKGYNASVDAIGVQSSSEGFMGSSFAKTTTTFSCWFLAFAGEIPAGTLFCWAVEGMGAEL